MTKHRKMDDSKESTPLGRSTAVRGNLTNETIVFPSLPSPAEKIEPKFTSRPVGKWTVPEEGFPPAPELLERTTLWCRPTLSAQHVLDKVAQFLRPTTVECSFNRISEIICRFQCSLKFIIHFWQENSVLVELQRRRGCGVGFHRIKRELFAWLAQDDPNSTVRAIPDLPLVSLPPYFESSKRPPEVSEDKDNEVEYCQELLNGRKSFREGLEHLLFVVTNQKDFDLFASEPYRECFLQHIAEHLSTGMIDPYVEKQTEETRIALRILARSLSHRSSSLHLYEPEWSGMIAFLRECVQQAALHHQEAALSIQCLRILYALSKDKKLLQQFFLNTQFFVDLQEAYLIGKMHHQPLAEEASLMKERVWLSTRR